MGLALARCLSAGACVLLTAVAQAQAIDPGPVTATLGAPLDLLVLVRPSSELGAGRFGRQCLHLQVDMGARRIGNRSLSVEIGDVDDAGMSPVRVRHPAVVDEPVLILRVDLVCGDHLSRAIEVLPLPGRTRAAANTPRVAAPSARVPALTDRSPSAHAPDRAPSLAPTPPPAEGPAASHDPPLASTEWRSLMGSMTKLMRSAGAQGLSQLPPADDGLDLAAMSAQLKHLEQEVQRLRAESRQVSTQVQALDARVNEVQQQRWQQAAWMALAGAGGAMLALTALGVFNGLRLRFGGLLRARVSRAAEPQVLSGGRAAGFRGAAAAAGLPADPTHRNSASRFAAWARQAEELAATAPPGRPAARPAAAAQHTVDAEGIDFSAEAPRPAEPADAVATTDLAAQGAASQRRQRWSELSFGHASFDHSRVQQVREAIDTAIAQGYAGFAATMLEQMLQSEGGKHPWVLLRLLDAYGRLGQPENCERVSAEIEALFNVHVPADGAHPSTQDMLAESGAGWDTLAAAWPDAQMTTALIEAWLLRGSSRPALSPGDMEELVFLHELRGLAEHVATAEAP